MPNAMNKFKPNQLIKVEKENENKDIKRKLKSIQKEKILPIRAETVWERLSKVKKTVNNETNDDTKSRPMIATKSNHRLQPVRSTGKHVTNKQKPLASAANTPNSHAFQGSSKPKSFNANNTTIATNAKRVSEKRSAKKFRIPVPPLPLEEDIENIPYVGKPLKAVQELLTARSMSTSKSSSGGSKNSSKPPFSERSCISHKYLEGRYSHSYSYFGVGKRQTANMSKESLDVYEVAPLMSVPTKGSLTCSAKITENFCSLLEGKKRTMNPDDIKMVKDCVKTDERHRQLTKNDSQLFKDILRTQLQEILKQETVLKSALNNLEETVSIDSTQEADPLTMVDEAASGSKKPQVDVIFKNVPTLEKEIIILRALGEKLEATLKRTVSQGTMDLDDLRSLVSAASVHAKLLETATVMETVHNALVNVNPLGIRQQRGFIREFRIEHKTIIELKEHANRHFYLPSNLDNSVLKRTSFRRLKENPDVLMRHLKPKNTLVPFNVLEQDPIFFNSYLYNNTPSTDASAIDSFSFTNISECSFLMPPLHEGGDSTFGCPVYMQKMEPLKIEEIKTPRSVGSESSCTNGDNKIERSKSKVSFAGLSPRASNRNYSETKVVHDEQKQKEHKQQNQSEMIDDRNVLFEAPIRGKQRRRIRRDMTPVCLNKCLEPKNSLFKTIVVGAAQISVFLILIMAITYPDVKC